MDWDRSGLIFACLLCAACPGGGEEGTGTDGDSEGDDTTGSTGAVTLPATMSSAGTTTMEPTTEPMTTEPTTTSASESSTTTGDPGGMGCCEPHGTASCNEPDVATCVCKTLPECCVFEWDQPCVDAAMMDCEATCMGVDTGNTTMPGDCELQQIELSAATDAALSGGWEVTTSMIKGTEIAAIGGQDVSGSVLFTVAIPCSDTWFTWVRAIDAGQQDSFFVTLDAEPDPAAIFEDDCTDEPFGNPEYRWTLLNWRDNSGPEPAPQCEYVEDPWTADWDEGDHAIEFSFRDAYALSRIIVTNDPDFVPE